MAQARGRDLEATVRATAAEVTAGPAADLCPACLGGSEAPSLVTGSTTSSRVVTVVVSGENRTRQGGELRFLPRHLPNRAVANGAARAPLATGAEPIQEAVAAVI